MHEFNIQEDYYLATIVNFSKESMGFMEISFLFKTSVHNIEFILGGKLLRNAFNEANSTKAKFPIEDQFRMTRKVLCLENIGLDLAPMA